jgi:outer membrane autotransporter protein
MRRALLLGTAVGALNIGLASIALASPPDVTGDATITGVGVSTATGTILGTVTGTVVNNGSISASAGGAINVIGTVGGDVVNNAGGSISASGIGIAVGTTLIGSGTVVGGQVSNAGYINSQGAAAVLIAGTIGQGLTNSGTIISGNAANQVGGDGIDVAGDVGDNVVNAATGSIASYSIGIFVDGSVGTGVTNAGTISGWTAGIRVAGDVASGGVTNGGMINAFSTILTTGIDIQGSVEGGVTNTGTILTENGAGTLGSYGIHVGGDVDGSVYYGGSIAAAEAGIYVGGSVTGSVILANGSTISNTGGYGMDLDAGSSYGPSHQTGIVTGGTVGGITNAGVITVGLTGIRSHGDVGGSVLNTGMIQSTNRTGILINGTVAGDVSNNGTISGISGGIDINGTVAQGITNSGLITADNNGIAANAVEGDVSNGGTITVGGSGIIIGDLEGNLINTGKITAGDAYGIFVGALSGSLSNSGHISGTNAISIGTLTGDLVNSGTIIAQDVSGTIHGLGIDLGQGAGGALINSGLIQATGATAVEIGGGHLDVTNTGTIIGGNGVAFDYTQETAASTITQVSGLIQGDIDLSSSYADMVDLEGGALHGAINGADATVEVHEATPFTITGNYTQGVGGTLVANINGAADTTPFLTVTGTATIPSGSAVVVEDSGTLPTGPETYTIVSGGSGSSYTGADLSVNVANPYLGISATDTISGDDLVVTVSNSGGPLGSASQTDVDAALNATPNSRSVADALFQISQRFGTDGTPLLADINNFFDNGSSPLTEAQKVQLVSAQLVPSNAATDTQTTQSFSDATGSAIGQHLQTARTGEDDPATGLAAGSEARNSAFWGQLLGYMARQDTQGDSQGNKAKTLGAAFGADTAVTPRLRLGGAFSYGKSYVDGLDFASGNSDHIDSYQLTGYGSYDGGAWYVNGHIGLGLSTYDQSRTTAFTTGAAKANYDGIDLVTHVDAGRDFQFGQTKLTPIAGLTYIHEAIDSYTESNTEEHIGSVDFDSVQTELGGQASWQLAMAGGRLVPTAKIGWLHDWVRAPIDTTSTLSGVSFNTSAARPTADGLDLGLAATFYSQGNWDLQAQYDGNFFRDFTSSAVLANVKVHF